MNCDCIEKLRRNLQREFGESVEFTNMGFGINIKTGQMSEKPEPIRFRYHPKKKDGTQSKAWTKAYIGFNFCPMCGKPVKEPGRARKSA